MARGRRGPRGAAVIVTRTTERNLVDQVDSSSTDRPTAAASRSALQRRATGTRRPLRRQLTDASERLSPVFVGVIDDGAVETVFAPDLGVDDSAVPTIDVQAGRRRGRRHAFTRAKSAGDRYRVRAVLRPSADLRRASSALPLDVDATRSSAGSCRRDHRDRRHPRRARPRHLLGDPPRRATDQGHGRTRRRASPAATCRSGARARPAHRGRRARLRPEPDARRASRRRSTSARRRRSACAGSWPTPRTSCARRSRPSAATPSCTAPAGSTDATSSTRRCAAPSRRRSAWAASSRTCCELARLDQGRPLEHAPGRPRRACPRRGGRRPGARPRARPIAVEPDDPSWCTATTTGCARSSPTWSATRSCTPRPGARSSSRARARARRDARGQRRRPGHAAEVAERAFERFYRADPSRSRHEAARPRPVDRRRDRAAHGGRAELHTAPDEGTTVRIALPASGALRVSESRPIAVEPAQAQ